MRAIFAGFLLLACAAPACGGEIIDYSAPPSPTRTPVAIVRLVPLRESSPEATRDPAIENAIDAELGLEEALYDWALSVREGAASRAQLQDICRSPSAQVAKYPGLDPASICFMVSARPYSRTLREWADIIELNFERYYVGSHAEDRE